MKACFNPKREAHPLQTGLFRKQSAIKGSVSIPNGKPILFRRSSTGISTAWAFCFNPKREAHPLQTLAQAHFERYAKAGFNPKREAHPLQTETRFVQAGGAQASFQSQTGSPSCSDCESPK